MTGYGGDDFPMIDKNGDGVISKEDFVDCSRFDRVLKDSLSTKEINVDSVSVYYHMGKVSYRSIVTTGDPVPVGQWDVPVNHSTG